MTKSGSGVADNSKAKQGLPPQSSDQDRVLQMQWARVRSMVGELRSHIPHDVTKKKRERNYIVTQLPKNQVHMENMNLSIFI